MDSYISMDAKIVTSDCRVKCGSLLICKKRGILALSIYCEIYNCEIQYDRRSELKSLTSNIRSGTMILGITKTVSGSPFTGSTSANSHEKGGIRMGNLKKGYYQVVLC